MEDIVAPEAEKELGKEILRVEDLCVSFDEKVVLDGLSFSVREGENYVVIGRSGCGKSVLLRCILGLIKPDSGKIFLWGVDTVPLSEEELAPYRQKMAIVFQAGALFNSMTVGENIRLALVEVQHRLTTQIDEIVKKVLSMVSLEGIENLKVSELSGGMKKRVAIARAIALEPEIIFYDEPTTGLDPPLADTIDELIYSLNRKMKKATITVTHDMVAAKYFGDRVGLIENGKMVLEKNVVDLEATDHPVLQTFLHRREEH